MNKENDGASVIVERYIFIVSQIYQSNIYNHIKYIVWSIFCPNCCQRQYMIESESLHMLDVDFCYIYLIKSRERSGSVVECLTRDRRAEGSSLTGVTALWSLSKTHLS